MKIELLEVLPEPIPKKALNASEVWGSTLVFDSGEALHRYLRCLGPRKEYAPSCHLRDSQEILRDNC